MTDLEKAINQILARSGTETALAKQMLSRGDSKKKVLNTILAKRVYNSTEPIRGEGEEELEYRGCRI